VLRMRRAVGPDPDRCGRRGGGPIGPTFAPSASLRAGLDGTKIGDRPVSPADQVAAWRWLHRGRSGPGPDGLMGTGSEANFGWRRVPERSIPAPYSAYSPSSPRTFRAEYGGVWAPATGSRLRCASYSAYSPILRTRFSCGVWGSMLLSTGFGAVEPPSAGPRQASLAPRINQRPVPARAYLAYLAYLAGRAPDKYGGRPRSERGKSLESMTTRRRMVGPGRLANDSVRSSLIAL
jgi:hypothetical protein